MRDPKRIADFEKIFYQLWNSVPDWRFGQLLCNLYGFMYEKSGKDPFFIEDDKGLELLRKACEEWSGNRLI